MPAHALYTKSKIEAPKRRRNEPRLHVTCTDQQCRALTLSVIRLIRSSVAKRLRFTVSRAYMAYVSIVVLSHVEPHQSWVQARCSTAWCSGRPLDASNLSARQGSSIFVEQNGVDEAAKETRSSKPWTWNLVWSSEVVKFVKCSSYSICLLLY